MLGSFVLVSILDLKEESFYDKELIDYIEHSSLQ